MFLTKECDYGIRVIRALANYQKKTVEEISDAEHIPHQYAYKILKKLERVGFVQSLRGRDGGYQLAKPLYTFTLYDVVSAVDENLFLFECLRGSKLCPLNNLEKPCAVHLEFERIQELLVSEMRSKTMDEVLSDVHGNKEATHLL